MSSAEALELRRRAREFEHVLLSLDRLGAQRLFAEASRFWPGVTILDGIVTPALEAVGAGWEAGHVALAQVYMAGRICEELVDAHASSSIPFRPRQPRMAIAVLDDFHALGKRIVRGVLRAAGFEVADYGAGLEPDALAERALDDNIEILLVSTLMLRSALRVRELSDLLAAAGSTMKVVVGGAPFVFDPTLADRVGAAAVGRSASDAVAIVNRLAGGEHENA
jgi:methanogenic corrinoid protein MtbC1